MSHLLKKSLMENIIFCAVSVAIAHTHDIVASLKFFQSYFEKDLAKHIPEGTLSGTRFYDNFLKFTLALVRLFRKSTACQQYTRQ